MTKKHGFQRVGSTRHHVMLVEPTGSGQDIQTYTPEELEELKELYGYTLEEPDALERWNKCPDIDEESWPGEE